MASKTPLASDIMSTKIASIAPEAGVRLAAEFMLKRKVSALLVLDPKKRLLGIVSEGDLVHRAELGTRKKGSWWLNMLASDRDLARQYARAHGRRVADVMTRNCVVASPGTTVAEPISITVTEPTSTTTAEPTSTIVAEPILNTTVAEPVLNTTVAEPISTTTAIIDIDEEIKIKAIEYIQPKIYIDNNYNPISEKYNDIIDNKNSNLYICITHADIIIDLDKKNYKIYKVNFNIRKPTEDRYNLFEKIINNINTYYFNINYDVMYITYHLSDVINSIYYINTMSISLTDNIDAINIDLIQHTATSISQEIDYKPFIFNEVKLKVVDINF